MEPTGYPCIPAQQLFQYPLALGLHSSAGRLQSEKKHFVASVLSFKADRGCKSPGIFHLRVRLGKKTGNKQKRNSCEASVWQCACGKRNTDKKELNWMMAERGSATIWVLPSVWPEPRAEYLPPLSQSEGGAAPYGGHVHASRRPPRYRPADPSPVTRSARERRRDADERDSLQRALLLRAERKQSKTIQNAAQLLLFSAIASDNE